MSYRAVLFDFDGTLANTLPRTRELYNVLAEKHGFRRFSIEEAEQVRDLHGQELLKAMNIPLWKLPRVVNEMRLAMREHVHEFTLFPGTREMLSTLRAAGLRLGVVTSNSEENARVVLGPSASDLEQFTCGVAMFGKAAKLRSTAKRMKLPAEEVIYIGDEVRDAEAAHAAGMAYGAVSWGQHSIDLLRKQSPAAWFSDMADLTRQLLPRA